MRHAAFGAFETSSNQDKQAIETGSNRDKQAIKTSRQSRLAAIETSRQSIPAARIETGSHLDLQQQSRPAEIDTLSNCDQQQ